MRIGSRYTIIGPTSLARFSLGVQPVGMKKAVIRPQAMKAAMFGMTIPAMKPPHRCMRSCIGHLQWRYCAAFLQGLRDHPRMFLRAFPDLMGRTPKISDER